MANFVHQVFDRPIGPGPPSLPPRARLAISNTSAP